MAPDSALRRAHRGEAWGIDMYEVLARSRIVVNRHGPVAAGYANNMRLFEATGAGAMLDHRGGPNLRDYFEPGSEVVSYDGPDDLMEKLRHYLEHDRGADRDRGRRAAADACAITPTKGDREAQRDPRGAAFVSAKREFCTLFDSNYLSRRLRCTARWSATAPPST